MLGPVATARQHLDVAKQRHELFHIGDMLGRPGKREVYVMITGDVKRWYRHLRLLEGRHQLPVAIDIAIVVEGTAKTAARKFSGIDIEVGLAKP